MPKVINPEETSGGEAFELFMNASNPIGGKNNE